MVAVTIQQIAEQAGVSRGTVDRALNHRGRIDPQVAARIQKISEDLGYVHKARKRQKNPAYRVKIGIVTHLSKASFMLEVNRGIQRAKDELKERGAEIFIKEIESVNEADQVAAVEELVKEGIQGLAIMPVDGERIRDRLNWMAVEKKIPIITFNSDIVGTRRSCFVGMDNRRSGQTAAGLLGLVTRGEGKILIITGYFSSHVNNLRVDGFVEEIKKSFPTLEIAGVQGSFNDPQEVEHIIQNAMNDISGISGIYVVSAGQAGIGAAFSKLKLPARPYVVIYDQTPKNESLLEEGTVDFVIDQNGFEQGYRPPCLLMDQLTKGLEPEQEFLYTGIHIKTKYNL